jgi:hypothetical protein
MPPTKQRQSITLPATTSQRIRALAKSRHISANRVLVDLVNAGLRAKEQEKRKFYELAERLQGSADPEEQAKLKEELARMTFGS